MRKWLPVCNRDSASAKRKEFMGSIPLIPTVVKQEKIFILHTHFWEGGFMYLLFGPAMAALVVIAVIQLRDHFVASR
jgi:hypothetical protein